MEMGLQCIIILGSVLDNLSKNFEDVDCLRKTEDWRICSSCDIVGERDFDICCKHFYLIYANVFLYVEYCSHVIFITPSSNPTRGKFL